MGCLICNYSHGCSFSRSDWKQMNQFKSKLIEGRTWTKHKPWGSCWNQRRAPQQNHCYLTADWPSSTGLRETQTVKPYCYYSNSFVPLANAWTRFVLAEWMETQEMWNLHIKTNSIHTLIQHPYCKYQHNLCVYQKQNLHREANRRSEVGYGSGNSPVVLEVLCGRASSSLLWICVTNTTTRD